MKKVLLVEDEVLIGMMLKKKLEQKGYNVCGVCTTGLQAIEGAKKLMPDVVVMDVSLGGGLSGLEAAKIIDEQMKVSLIFYTGNHMDEKLRRQVAELSSAAVLDKLGPIENLYSTIEIIGCSSL